MSRLAIWEVETISGVVVGGVNAGSADEAIQRISAFSRISARNLRAFTAEARQNKRFSGKNGLDCASYGCNGLGTHGGCVSVCAAEADNADQPSAGSGGGPVANDTIPAPLNFVIAAAQVDPPLAAPVAPMVDAPIIDVPIEEAPLEFVWSFEIDDIAAIPLEMIRPYFTPARITDAVAAYVQAGGRRLAGVRVFQKLP